MRITKNKTFWKIAAALLFLEVPISCAPQLFKMWQTGSSRDVSVAAWLSMACFSVLWALYGLRDADKIRIWTGVLFCGSEIIVAMYAIALRL
jgi:uncharacterized protein with PQ loop repeat